MAHLFDNLLFGLIVVSTFTIGLAANTLKFDIHYKTIATNVLLLLLQGGVIFMAIYFTYKAEFKALEVSQDTIWQNQAKINLPPLTHV